MGQFIKSIFSSCLGVLLALFVITTISMMVFGRMASMANQPVAVKPNSVLNVKFGDMIPDKTNNVQVSTLDFKNSKVLGLQEIISTIRSAKEDDNIKGIYLESDFVPLGFSSVTALREALIDFRSEGKFVLSYSKYYTQGAYYLATASDQIYVNPIGLVDFKGFSAQIPFYKDMLDKLGVKMEVFYAGKFKSATEPFRRNNMSDESKLQVRSYLEARYRNLLEAVSEERGIEVGTLRGLADSYTGADVNQALASGMVDVVGYENDAYDAIRKKVGLDENEKINFISLKSYNNSNPSKVNLREKNKIAVIFAEGTVIDGEGEYGTIGDRRYVDIINRVRKDKKVKAVVLRVNSGGGSAMSSENIWNALMRLKEEKEIPVVVSMGDVAASGGYYIACPADQIYAEPNTLTGSIGVFSMFPNMTELFNEKMGIRFDTVNTGKLATGITPYFPLSPVERKIMQNRTDSLYAVFLRRVGKGRDMTVEEVNEIAQGRVWSGPKAKEIGLVDEIGDLSDAIAKAGELANLSGYRLTEYPKVKDPVQRLIEELTDESFDITANKMLRKELGEWYPMYEHLKEIRNSRGAQMRVPFIVPDF